jgi:preprotein translocase subunit SecA
VLNAKNHEQEARIISQAGKKGAVTVATNIAGRGIDIKLGGEVPEDEKKLGAWEKDNELVKSLGGLFVMGTERHESRRIDNQLRGRAGRQGDPGNTRFYISLQDFIIRVFGGDRVKFYDMLPIPEDQSIDNPALSYIINEAQKKIEGQNFDQRKYVTEYDDVTNRQRSVIYTRRNKVLLGEGFQWQKESKKAIYNEVYRIINTIPKPKRKSGIDKKAIKQAGADLKAILPLTDFDPDVLEILLRDNKYKHAKLVKIIHNKIMHQLNNRWEIYEDRVQYGLARFVFLRSIDVLWKEHLVTISHLQDVVRLRVFSQKDPLVEFKQEGMSLFVNLLQEIDKEISRTIFKVSPDLVPASMLKEQKK